MKSVWWHSATNEQRLAQIAAARELEMSIEQMAMNFQISKSAMSWFLKSNNISWKDMQHTRSHQNIKKANSDKKIQFISKIDNTAIDEAFTLFQNNGRNFEMNFLESY